MPASFARTDPANTPPSAFKTLGWGAYLGMSWTWCIGMFLPVLLVRDFGPWAFVVFALPNVLGAAGVGWLVRSGDQAMLIAREHAPMTRAFSAVTGAYQMFFLVLVGTSLVTTQPAGTAWPLPSFLLVGMLGAVLAGRPSWGGLVLWGASAGLLTWTLLSAGVNIAPTPARLSPDHLVPLACVCVLGFGLCPYLDLTFLRARQVLGPSAKAGFALGFGLFFFTMILGTLLYSGWAQRWVFDRQTIPGVVGLAVAGHMTMQLVYTHCVHLIQVRRHTGLRSMSRQHAGMMLIACAAAYAVGYVPGVTFELVYRLFLSFYGLIFPAYVWICLIPRRDEPIARPVRAHVIVWLLACAIASPCYWLGFIEQQTWWLVPGVVIVLAARWLPTGARRATN